MRAVDRFAYSGVDVRNIIHNTIIPQTADVVDLCCGIGFSTSSIDWRARMAHLVGRATDETRSITGVDTSEQMLAMARLRRPEVSSSHGPPPSHLHAT